MVQYAQKHGVYMMINQIIDIKSNKSRGTGTMAQPPTGLRVY
jgi:hypothetical protein